MGENRLRILIAEDESVTVLSLKKTLEGMGHSVVAIARDGKEAILHAERVRPDLILMDIKMSGLNGLDAAEEILQKRPTPVIILTAYSEKSFIERASDIGISTYLVKPVTDEDLKPAITLAIDRFRERQSLASAVSIMKETLENKKFIEKAKWILVKQFGISEDEAHRRLQQLSREGNVKMVEIAKSIISGGKTQE
ncbi:MAG: response regulator [Gemmatimonadota bacterium]|nr:MAG: response regulator [Gemmatimonadota bacterium]